MQARFGEGRLETDCLRKLPERNSGISEEQQYRAGRLLYGDSTPEWRRCFRAIPPPLRCAPSRSHAPLLSVSRTKEWQKKPWGFSPWRSVTSSLFTPHVKPFVSRMCHPERYGQLNSFPIL